ncbi:MULTISPECIES: DUF4079 domain-containing protein [unclassified Coleofasciculus]|uniref:DUF4079 domain-containing protein n=1 Tax=unclassified Coleofasciculus TaxID=2692782 RepID=UPI00187EE56A|nr:MULTISPECIES: DUF4079 domain-containing protein [unclassified Coleofasciculus]MBE9129978.1 DUF4079 domain-containing protein [Coleofasciculus sp. LEGE 07081]MBE9151937.1 DUF4079 domain-containing protein [Coleofasciculus sp. LEGE 07092]
METVDFFALIHPILAVVVVFPIIGIVVHFAWQTRQRRLQTADGGKSKIPPVVGREHVQLGRWLTGSVVGITLVALAYVIFAKSVIKNQLWSKNPTQAILIVLFFIAAITSLVLLYRARQQLWRGIFATSTGLWLVVLGCQEGVFRRTNEWYWSHYYIGITAALLMVFSLAIVEDIYKDRSNRWRYAHIALNCFALLLFFGQGMTGMRDLFEIAFYEGLAAK